MEYKTWLAILCPVMVLCILIDTLWGRGKRDWLGRRFAFGILAICYPIGKTLQFWHAGPLIVRWYISDIGFMPFFVFWAMVMRLRARTLQKIVAITCWIAISQEVVMIALTKTVSHRPLTNYGARGDWIDVGIFVAMYFITSHLLPREEKRLRQTRRMP